MMYIDLHKWDDALRIAEQRNHPKLDNLRANYFQVLLDSHQEVSSLHCLARVMAETFGNFGTVFYFWKAFDAFKTLNLILLHHQKNGKPHF